MMYLTIHRIESLVDALTPGFQSAIPAAHGCIVRLGQVMISYLSFHQWQICLATS